MSLREGIADPQGATIERSLPALGFSGISDVRVGKLISLSVEADDEPTARSLVDQLCRRFLANPVLEDASVSVMAPTKAAG